MRKWDSAEGAPALKIGTGNGFNLQPPKTLTVPIYLPLSGIQAPRD
jgi:hypothetical protein